MTDPLTGPEQADRSDSKTKTTDSLESLVGSLVLSVALLVYGGYGLANNDIALPTRLGVQHLHDLDAVALYVLAIFAVPANAVRVWAWARDGDGTGEDYQMAKLVGRVVIFAFIAYVLFRRARGGV